MLQEYQWWGNDNEPSENLKTKKQLSELGLAPVQAVGVIHCRKYDLYLYDINNPESVRSKRKLSEKQKANIKQLAEINKARHHQKWWEEYCARFELDKKRAIQSCRDFLSSNDWVILDTETTGL
ncbi:hypothetical protein [Moorena sp. SIO4G3]|uniref:hypothetical protein n=1 Tax=Moorena sp. SIO4G3 TaxID=2607821 RepID=UPI0014291958|nr:hypothetical protein [Moorena sp. SIO4G3]NEO81980.1 hypothetical protein [Moorena sp. SIO4G3]